MIVAGLKTYLFPILAILGLIGVSLIGSKLNSTTPDDKVQPSRQTYTMDSICNSTLNDKYNADDFWNENVIEFGGHKYKVIDQNGGRRFDPIETDTPELILTQKPNPIGYCVSHNSVITNPTVPQVKTIKPNSNGTNSDPIIKCTRHANCGGGYIEIKASECSNQICCETTYGNYSFISKNECSRLHSQTGQSQPNQNEEYVGVYLPHNNTTISCVKSISDRVYEASLMIKKTQDSSDSLKGTKEQTKNNCNSLCEINYSSNTSNDYNNYGKYLECKQSCESDYQKSLGESGVQDYQYQYLNELLGIGCR